MRARALFHRVAAATWLTMLPVRAQPNPGPLQLHWAAPADCPRAVAFEAAVGRLVGAVPSPRVRAEVRISQDAPGEFTLRLTTELNGTTGERILRSDSCQALVDAAAITVALILNPDVEIPTDEAIEAPKRETQAPPWVPPAQPTRASPTVPTRSRQDASASVHWVVAPAMGLQLGVLPQPVPQASLGLGAAIGQALGLVWASYALPRNVWLDASNTGGRLWSFTLGAAGCGATSPSPPRVGGCVVGSWTTVQGHGLGVTPERHGGTNWFAPGLGAFLDLPLNRRAWFQLAAFGVAPTARPDTHLDYVGLVQRPSAVTANLHAGVMVVFN